LFLKKFPDNKKEAEALSEFIKNDMTLNYFLEEKDFELFFLI